MTSNPSPGAFAALQRARIRASELSESAFAEVEERFARGLPYEDAKRVVLEERVPGILAEHGEEVADMMIEAVMAVPLGGVDPKAKAAHAKRRWRALVEAHVAAGGRAPSTLEQRLHDWFGIVPRRMRR
ncbi:MAG TPA: hypothetical protein VEA41_01480 [Salinarimonas sp.]|nr:hypothetical protein [Salinarimonas sp.]